MELNTFGERLIYARTRLGWSQADFVRHSQVPQNVVTKIERGDQKNSAKYLFQMADALQVNAMWLSTGEGDMTAETASSLDISYLDDPAFLRRATDYDTVQESGTGDDTPMLRRKVSKPRPDDASPKSMLSRLRHMVYPVRAADDRDVGILQYKDARFSAGPGFQNQEYGELDELVFKQSYLDRSGLNPENCFVVYADGDSMWPFLSDGEVMLVNMDRTDFRSKDGQVWAFAFGDECRVKRVYSMVDGSVRLSSDNPDKTRYPDEIYRGEDLSALRCLGHVHWRGGDM